MRNLRFKRMQKNIWLIENLETKNRKYRVRRGFLGREYSKYFSKLADARNWNKEFESKVVNYLSATSKPNPDKLYKLM